MKITLDLTTADAQRVAWLLQTGVEKIANRRTPPDGMTYGDAYAALSAGERVILLLAQAVESTAGETL